MVINSVKRYDIKGKKLLTTNYPKYVISGDVPDFSGNGIKHSNIVKFLLDK